MANLACAFSSPILPTWVGDKSKKLENPSIKYKTQEIDDEDDEEKDDKEKDDEEKDDDDDDDDGDDDDDEDGDDDDSKGYSETKTFKGYCSACFSL